MDGGADQRPLPAFRLPGAKAATLRLRYWVGLGADAGAADGLPVRLVDPATGDELATRSTCAATASAHLRPGTGSSTPVPAALRGRWVAIELEAVDAGAGTVEAGVDDVRVTLAAP